MKKINYSLPLLIGLTLVPFLYPLTQINLNLISSDLSNFYLNIANTFGFLGAVLLTWSLLLGIRFIVNLFTPDIFAVNKIHQLIGKYGIVFILLHPIVEMLVYLENLAWLILPDVSSEVELFITFGRISFLLFIVIWVTSALLRERMKFRPWLYLHYIAYPIVLFVLLHALEIGTYVGGSPVFRFLWINLIMLYAMIVIFRVLMFMGLGSATLTLTKKEKINENLFVFYFKPKANFLTPKPGQYYYFQLRKFGETHPFSVLEFNPQTQEISFGVKVYGPFTKKMINLPLGATIRSDGPYGVFTQDGLNFSPKVIIAGGIGITPFVELIKQYGDQNTVLLNCNKTAKDVLNRQFFISKLGDNYTDFLSRDTLVGPQIQNGHITPNFIIQSLKGKDKGLYTYYICGSKQFINGVRNMLKQMGVKNSKVKYEIFN